MTLSRHEHEVYLRLLTGAACHLIG
jgi:hypothetical protein